MHNKNWNDQELAESLKFGDRRALGIIYDRYSEKMYESAYAILKDKEKCEDIVHELFVTIWLNRKKFNVTSLQGYLLTAVRNRVISYIRKKKELTDLSFVEEIICDFPSVDGKLITEEINRIVDKEVSNLPPKCQQIFVLSRHERLANKEIASKLSITVKTVENQLSIALKRLRSSLHDFI